jgi:uncharacterized protein (TIRG00374 family)
VPTLQYASPVPGEGTEPEVEELSHELRGQAPRRTLRWLFQLTLVALAFYLSWRLLAGLSWEELTTRLGEASPWLTALAGLAMVARFVLWDLRWRRAFARLGERPPGLIRSFFALLSGACVNLVTPTARIFGGLLRARYVARRSSHSFATIYGTVLYDQVAHSVVMGGLTWLALVGFAWVLGQRWLAAATALALLVATAMAVRWLVGPDWLAAGRVGESFRRLAARRRLAGLMAHGREAYQVVRTLLADVPLRRDALLLGLAYYLLNVSAQWLVFLALERPVDPLVVLLAVTLGTAAGIVTGTPGGLGTTEAGMILAYVALDVPRIDAAAGTLLFRALHYLSVLAPGLPALIAFELREHPRRRR